MRIEQIAGLSEDEIERRRREADSHADEDKKKRTLAELRNQADTLTWQLEKLLQEHDTKLGAGDKEAVSKAIEKTRTAAKGEDVDAIKSALHELEQASHALSKTLYAKTGQQPGGPSAPGGAAPGADGGPQPAAGQQGGGEDEPIDAEFEVK